MGAIELRTVMKTQSKKKFEKMYNNQWDADRHYYGVDPYSGSWATIDWLRYLKDPFPNRKWTAKKYREVWEYMSDNCDKWEAVTIKSPKGFLLLGWAGH